MAGPHFLQDFLRTCCIKSNVHWLWLWMLIGIALPLHAQSTVRIDSLPHAGLQLRSGWRWHAGDNPTWGSPAFDDSQWDTIRPSRNITHLPAFAKSPRGWFRLTFALDSAVAGASMAFLFNQTGASEIYLDGKLFQRLGEVGETFDQQQAYIPSSGDVFLLPNLSVGRHVMAVRLSQHRSPWYQPKLLYFNQPVFKVTLYRTGQVIGQEIKQLYIQTLGNFFLVGIFLMLGVIHLMYYRYRRKRVNLIFCLTTFFAALYFILIEIVLRTHQLMVAEWLFLGQGLCVMFFILFLLITYYVYLEQAIGWPLASIAILLLAPRLASYFVEPATTINIISFVAVVASFADGIRISVDAVRAGRVNARFMLISIVVLVVVMVLGALVGWWVSETYPAYTAYSTAITNMVFFLVLPVSFAIILAREYAQTSRNLEERLTEVAQLSREKEDILTRQNETLERQVSERTGELSRSLTELKETQQQLIQREKMASLGELTAGIAHEIQNPLNFVNNFAEVSAELVQELQQERDSEQRDEELEAEILQDLEQNLQKIKHHGGRASSIVRGMLDHSRTSTGQSEPTDLNALSDEYLRLSYHGLRAKDKNFNATLVTHFDPALGQTTVVAQDIGRVLLNLFNNAFYAVHERQLLAQPGYQPTVSVTTQKLNAGVEIRVSDNGTGISEGIQKKIFQPFFTTKPTGQGTGLGLSLSYDIITKGHNGTLMLETKVDGGVEFVIRLPAN